jgi:PKD repeat protein
MKKWIIVPILVLSIVLMGASRERQVYLRTQKIIQSTDVIFMETPVADFTISGSVGGRAPQTITFDDVSTGGATSWLWNFGGLATSTAQDTVYTFGTGAPADVTLTVSNSAGQDSRVVTSAVDFLDPYFKPVTFSITMVSGKIRCTTIAMTPWSSGTVNIRYYDNDTNAVISTPAGASAVYGPNPIASPVGATVADGINVRVAYWTTNARTGFANVGSSEFPVIFGVWTMLDGDYARNGLIPIGEPVE